MGSRVIAYFGPATGERGMEQHPCKDPGLPGQALQLGPHPSIAPRRGSRGSRTRLPEGVHGIIHLREQNGSLLLLLLKALLGHQSCPVLHPASNTVATNNGAGPVSIRCHKEHSHSRACLPTGHSRKRCSKVSRGRGLAEAQQGAQQRVSRSPGWAAG